MPRLISTRANDIRVDDKAISAAAISTSLSSEAGLEAEVKSTLETQEVHEGRWDLYVHVYDRATGWVGIHMYRHGTRVPDDWWEAALEEYVPPEERESPAELSG